MPHLDLIVTLTGGLAAALILGYVTHRLGLSPLLGYLAAGIAVGPYTPGFVANQPLAEELAEVGVILLMFGIGLQFHLEELLAVRRVAITGAIGQSFIATALGAVVMHSFGWDWLAGIVFGLSISVASTVVLLRVLSDNHDLHTPTGHIALGWLVVEDLFTVIVLVLLPTLLAGGAAGIAIALGVTAMKIVILVAFTFLVGGRVIPWLLEHVAATRSRELFTLTVLVLALGIAVGSARLFGVSMALGAFLAGMVVGRSEFSLRAASEALPLRDAFAVLFFVSIGMLFDPRAMLELPGLFAATCGIILIGKPLAAFAIVLGLRYSLRTALAVAVVLAQIGEFSFILGTLGRNLGVLSQAALQTLVAASIVSITLNPLLYRLVKPLEAWVMRRPRLREWLNSRVSAGLPTQGILFAHPAVAKRHRAVIVGYGPVGQTVTRLLRDNAIEPTVIELNLETVRRLRESGLNAIYGDAGHRDTLTSAGVDCAGSLILSSSGTPADEEVIRVARELNPSIRVLVRSNYVRQVVALREAGAAGVFSGEGEVALALIEAILRPLGATAEQIDRERERFREDVLR
jgi:CPA2 family monovalent cation:H+ antiporter-2